MLARAISKKYPEIPLRLVARVIGVPKSSLAYESTLPNRDERMSEKIRVVHETQA